MSSIQNIEGWEVFDNGKPAIIKDSKKGWNNNFFREFADALKYAKSWLGEWDLAKIECDCEIFLSLAEVLTGFSDFNCE